MKFFLLVYIIYVNYDEICVISFDKILGRDFVCLFMCL